MNRTLLLSAPIEEALTSAVREAVSPVNQTSIAMAICRSQNGGARCLCERGSWRHCHAPSLYGDMAIAVLSLLKRTGILKRREEI